MSKKTIKQYALHRQAGLTLVELMVAMVISLLLIAGTITIFTSNKQAYRLNDASSRVQENGRFAFDFLRRDVRMAGFAGCLSKNLAGNFVNNVEPSNYSSAEADIANIVAGFDGTNSLRGYTIPSGGLSSGDLYTNGLRSGTAFAEAIINTDALVVTQGSECDGGSVVFPMPGTAANVKIADAVACGIIQQSVVMISDCENADLFRVVSNPVSGANKDTLTHSTVLNTSNNLSKAYGLDADVFALQTSIYYIGNGASDEPSLFRRRYSGAAGTIINEELVEGIEDMTVTYGVDTDGDGSANFYETANNITTANWPRVNSARIRLDVRSDAQNVVQSTAAGADRRLRHSFTETIKVRNKI
jgi:type IV pilus assembly protein PilW